MSFICWCIVFSQLSNQFLKLTIVRFDFFMKKSWNYYDWTPLKYTMKQPTHNILILCWWCMYVKQGIEDNDWSYLSFIGCDNFQIVNNWDLFILVLIVVLWNVINYVSKKKGWMDSHCSFPCLFIYKINTHFKITFRYQHNNGGQSYVLNIFHATFRREITYCTDIIIIIDRVKSGEIWFVKLLL